MENTSSCNSDLWVRCSLIEQFKLIDLLNEMHTTDDSSKHDCLIIQERERCTSCNIELALVCVLKATTFAHAKKTHLGVFDMERFVSELSFVDWSFITDLELATLDKHAWHDTVNIATDVRELFSIRLAFIALAEREEVFRCAWCNVVEKFKDDSFSLTMTWDGHTSILTCLWVVYCFLISIFSQLNIVIMAVLIKVGVVV